MHWFFAESTTEMVYVLFFGLIGWMYFLIRFIPGFSLLLLGFYWRGKSPSERRWFHQPRIYWILGLIYIAVFSAISLGQDNYQTFRGLEKYNGPIYQLASDRVALFAVQVSPKNDLQGDTVTLSYAQRQISNGWYELIQEENPPATSSDLETYQRCLLGNVVQENPCKLVGQVNNANLYYRSLREEGQGQGEASYRHYLIFQLDKRLITLITKTDVSITDDSTELILLAQSMSQMTTAEKVIYSLTKTSDWNLSLYPF